MAAKKKKITSQLLRDHMFEMTELVEGEKGWPFHSVSCGWTVFDDVSGGIRDRIYTIGGGAGTGKTSFLSNIVYHLLKTNEEMVGLFVSLDQSYLDLVARFFALSSGLSVEQIRDPSLIEDEEDHQRREIGLKSMEDLQNRLVIVDQSHGMESIDDLEKAVKELRADFPDVPLVVGIDPVMSLRAKIPKEAPEERSEHVMNRLRALARLTKSAVFLSTHIEGAAREKRPSLKDLENSPGIIYGSDMIALLYNDSLNEFDTPFIEWEWGSEDTMIPIVECNVLKNKNSNFLGRIYYRFQNSATRFLECSFSDNEHFNEMLGNLDYFDDPKAKNNDLKRKVYKAPERKYEPIF